MGVYEENIVPVKIASLAEYVSERKRVSLDEALVYIYSNDMYKNLYGTENPGSTEGGATGESKIRKKGRKERKDVRTLPYCLSPRHFPA